MIFEFVLLAQKTGDFGQDIALPAIVGTIVALLIIQQILSRMGYALW